jgi:hypothetical protein
MLTKLVKLLKMTILSAFWLVFPPIFYWLAKLWYPVHKELRRLMFVLSPIILLFIFTSVVYVYVLTSDALRGSKRTIERKTEMEFPSYSKNHFRYFLNVLQSNSMSSFHGDHSLGFKAKLKPSQCDDFFREIEQLINDTAYNLTNSTGVLTRSWSVDRNGNYSFYHLREKPEEVLSITINPKTYDMSVGLGTW